MEFLKFDDYLFEKSHHVKVDLITEASLTSSPSKDINFGVCITTYKIGEGTHAADDRRKNHMTTPKVLEEALRSIKDQKFKNWKVYLIGDAYPKEEWPEIEKLAKSIVGDNLFTHNLGKPGERDKWPSEIVHKTGGNTAANIAIAQMKSDGVSHFCRLDHDDAWKSDHLELHAKAYTQFPECIYILSQARKKSTDGSSYMYLPDHKNSVDYNNHTLSLGQQCHSAMTWDLAKTKHMKYRTWEMQKTSDPKRKECFPGDWDNTERIKSMIDDESNPYKLAYIPKLTTKYRNGNGKF